MRNIGLHLVANRQLAIGAALIFALLPFFGVPTGWIAAFVLALITLCRGPKDGFIVLIWAALPAMALYVTGNGIWLLNYVFLQLSIVWAMAWLLRRSGSWSLVIELMALVGIAIIALVHVFMPNITAWWLNQLAPFWQTVITSLHINISPGNEQKLIEWLARTASGAFADILIVINLAILWLARWTQFNLLRIQTLYNEYRNIRVTYTVGIILLASGFGFMLHSPLAIDALPVIALPFIVSGLSLIHALAARRTNGWLCLLAVYVMLFLFTPYLMILLGGLGLIDSWYNFRHRVVLAGIKLTSDNSSRRNLMR